jgi:hypothetical protein
MSTLAQSATKRKMLKHPSFRLAMTGEACGEQGRAQGDLGVVAAAVTGGRRERQPFDSAASDGGSYTPHWLGSCFLSNHE